MRRCCLRAFRRGAALPVLGIPIVNQHVLHAAVLFGAHTTHTLLDSHEIELLRALATSHSEVRTAMLQRENASLSIENSALALEKRRSRK